MISGYQIGSWHAILRLLSGTKKEENQSFDNINILLITSTILMVFPCVMEVLMYFHYNNKVEDNTDKYSNTDINIFNLHLQFHPRKEIVAEPEEKSEKKVAMVNIRSCLKWYMQLNFQEIARKRWVFWVKSKLLVLRNWKAKMHSNVTKTSDNLEMADWLTWTWLLFLTRFRTRTSTEKSEFT